MSGSLITSGLSLGNLILASANVIIGFSLLAYILTHNFRSPVARAFSAVLAFVAVVYVGDILVSNVISPPLTLLWLRFQWLGIAFVPAACFHFSDALLRTTNSVSSMRRVGVSGSYAVGFVFFVLAAVTDLVVLDNLTLPGIAHLVAGPYFGVFTAYFFVTVFASVANVFRARQRCLTSTSRRRMTYLTVAIVAPGTGVFPYLLVSNIGGSLSANVVYGLSVLANLAIALMTVISAYTVAYQGVFIPDRVIKHNLIHYLLRGPLVASMVIALMLVVPRVEGILGLPRDTVLVFAVIVSIVVLQVAVNLAKPYIDRLIYRQDREEVAWIQELDAHLLTSTDLAQLLENVLVALCDLLRVGSGFIVAMQEGALKIQVLCGPRVAATEFLKECRWQDLLSALGQGLDPRGELRNESFLQRNGYWLLPLRSKDGKSTLGILGIEAGDGEPALSAEELAIVSEFVGQAELALVDMHLQQDVFAALRRIVPEIDEIQRWRSASFYRVPARLQRLESNPVYAPDFHEVVKEALRHYWGGPDLTNSPLVRTQLVRRAMKEHDGIPARALRAVLGAAIEGLKPDGERSMTASEWVIYNILEMKVIQGRRIREIADRLAISESDLYRKQRTAVQQLAKVLAAMEMELTRSS
ncbi:MAG TPA: histidine kinase N-terminal 7TM domain-containing protein [Anaerolineae bacterium]|nr:histidine kinase N-terminal 7TM domain-containing protein [Anaerolineae bacterium]